MKEREELRVEVEAIAPSGEGKRPANWVRQVRTSIRAYPLISAGMLLVIAALSIAELAEVIPVLAPITRQVWYPFFDETAVVLALILVLYVGHRFDPVLGGLGVTLVSLLLVPYVALQYRTDGPEIVRLLAMVGAMAFATYLSVLRKRLHDLLHDMAIRDPITGLLNRRQFERELARQILVVQRYRLPASIVYLDLDGFKLVNDSLGHHAGDRLLISIAEILKQNVRTTDVVARLGGDEFALILAYTGLDEAKAVAERLVETFRAHRVVVGDRQVGATGSFGVVGVDRKSSVTDLMIAADLAMYAVKNRGGNGVSLVPLIG